ncbi:MAG TPA: polysaccharide deacetylase family protein [Sphingomicrobium sp.]|nr:polysaccharide deacetylase family protein [Sphingomicrobium sp.]
MKLRSLAAQLALFLAGCATVPAAEPLKLAITIDDLPVHGEAPSGENPASVADAMVKALLEGGAREAHGFVNGVWTERDPSAHGILAEWRKAGLPLANHGWAHRHLNDMTLDEFERELVRNEALLAGLATKGEWSWFRYPFLGEGDTAEKRADARRILARRGYRVAAVTMDFSDWQWTGPYARCADAGDTAAIARLEHSYLDSARQSIRFHRGLAQGLYGRDIPYVLLLHVSGMTARMMPRLLRLYRSEGFEFVSLEEAQRDPAYADQMDPALPALPQGLEGKARSRGLALPPRTDYAPLLEGICR